MGTFRVGDQLDYFDEMAARCHWAYNSLYPGACALSLGGSLFWSDDPERVELCCPDPNNPVVFELRRGEAWDQEIGSDRGR